MLSSPVVTVKKVKLKLEIFESVIVRITAANSLLDTVSFDCPLFNIPVIQRENWLFLSFCAAILCDNFLFASSFVWSLQTDGSLWCYLKPKAKAFTLMCE